MSGLSGTLLQAGDGAGMREKGVEVHDRLRNGRWGVKPTVGLPGTLRQADEGARRGQQGPEGGAGALCVQASGGARGPGEAERIHAD